MAAIFSSQDATYKGPNRRTYHRRQHEDRRDGIRFEPDNADRRQCPGRRSGERGGWSRSTL